MEKSEIGRSGPRKQILTAVLATVPTFTYGVQIGWLSPNGSILRSTTSPATPPLIESDITWLAAALPLAAIAGIPFFSYSSDHFGRKISIILVSLLSCISFIIKLTASEVYTFVIARIIAGLAASGCFVVVPVYIKEISEDSWRGALSSLVMTVCKLGVIAVYATGMLLPYKVNQAVYLAICMAHVVSFYFMPESPNYLLKQGKEKAAIKTIAWLRDLQRHEQPVVDELVKLKEERRRCDEAPPITLRSMINDKVTFSALKMTVTLMAIQTLSGAFALMNYAADVFERAGSTLDKNLLALLMGSLQLAGSFCTTMTIERFGRKKPLASSALIVSLCMGTLATYFLLQKLGTSVPGWMPATAMCVFMFAYGMGLAPVPMVLMAEVFNFEMRARMAGASMAFSFFCSSMTVLFYTPVANAMGAYVVFYTFGAVGLFGVVYTCLFVPETKGKSLEQIQAHWRGEDQSYDDDV